MKLFRGVIENNVSPEKDGRVQVRIFSVHDEDLSKVKTEDLPWAEVIQPNAFGFSTGIGFTSVPNIGTWVFVTLDHDNPNMPIVIGSISAKSTEKSDPSVGFNSPDGIFPLNDRLNEEDINRLSRVEKLDDTIHQKINDSLSENSDKAEVTIKEPNSKNQNSKYPDNSVLETKSGHVIEIDETPGNERIRIYHKSGTYEEISFEGDRVQKNVKDVYILTESNLKELVQKEVQRYIGSNLTEHIKGNVKLKVDGNLEWDIGGNIKITSGGTQTNTNGGNYKHVAPRIDLNP